MRGLLSNERYEELKKLVVEMFEEAEVNSLPIDCFYIAKKLHYVLRPYSTLNVDEFLDAFDESVDGFSRVEMDPESGMYRYVIYYNDMHFDMYHQRFTVFHEIAHCYLGHHDEEATPENEEIEEDAGCEELELDPPHATTESDMAAAIAITANFFFIMGSSLWKINRKNK